MEERLRIAKEATEIIEIFKKYRKCMTINDFQSLITELFHQYQYCDNNRIDWKSWDVFTMTFTKELRGILPFDQKYKPMLERLKNF